MKVLNFTSILAAVAIVSGCATDCPPGGPRGPELVTSGRATESGQYAEVGLEFTTWGDFAALGSPKRWKSPIATGGIISWMNPGAWRNDAGRTGRILLGEAVIVGGATAVAAATGGTNGSSSPGVSGGTGDSGPIPPPGSGGDVPPPPEI